MHVLRSIAAASLVLIIGAGCGDNNPTSAVAGSFPASATGSNTPVTSSNAATVWGTTFAQAFAVMGQGASVITKPVSPQGSGTVNGSVSGTAKFDGTVTASQTGVNVNSKITFDDFSNGGGIWMQGEMNYEFNTTTSPPTTDGTITGTINVAGDYQATLKWDISLSNSVPSGSVEITSDGNTFTFTL